MSGRGITMTRLANMLTGPTERAIPDRTDLSGTYDFTLKFTSDQATQTPGISDSSTDPCRNVQIFELFEIISGKRLRWPLQFRADLKQSLYITELLPHPDLADLVHILVIKNRI